MFLMKRRKFIALIAGAAAGWPLAARAQQSQEMHRVGIFLVAAKGDDDAQRRINVFKQELQKLGWTEGHNLRIDDRWTAGDRHRAQELAAELVKLKPEVILVQSALVLQSLQRETSTIPIVFVQINDPVGSGFVASLARPGGNITGLTPVEFSIGGKLLEVLKEAAPRVNGVAVVLAAEFATQIGMWRTIQTAAPSIGLNVEQASVRDAAEIERVIDAFARKPNGGLIVLANPVTNLHRQLIFALAAKHRLPAIYSYRFYVREGGLISYGADLEDQYRRAGAYVDRILRGEKPADLPVQQPTKYEMVINLKTARAAGLEIPPTLLARADEVIE